jgi:hypothetical protein
LHGTNIKQKRGLDKRLIDKRPEDKRRKTSDVRQPKDLIEI